MSRPLLIALLLVAGCGNEIRQRLRGVQAVIAQARTSGAYKCAPKELALAETHAEFTEAELAYGNHLGALDELRTADTNAKLALEHSPEDRCNPKPKPQEVPVDTDGDGLLDKEDRCPKEPGPKENQGCPWPDTDKDGLLDKEDRCPTVAGPKENHGCPWLDGDKDGLLDKDDKCPIVPGPSENLGCPWPDGDGDGVIDKDDHCPTVPGVPPDGCPPYKLIVVHDDKIELRQKVHFQTNKFKILSDSFPMLNEVADVLQKRPSVEVRIEGHTDSRAGRKHNMKLSQDRADSVRHYLESRGVDPVRMVSVGYGPDRPIDDNRTAVGRENNRRVEFLITRQ